MRLLPLALLASLLVAGLPTARAASSRSADDGSEGPRLERAPGVDLPRLRWTGHGYVAPSGSGGELPLGLDRATMQIAERLLARARPEAGAIVVADLSTLRLLAVTERRGRRASPLFGPGAPAASVFKLVTTTALLERGHVAPDQAVCTAGGKRRVDRAHLGSPSGAARRCTPFFAALGHSRNAVFAQLVTDRLTRADLVETARAYGFGGRLDMGADVEMGRFEAPYNDLEFARAATGFVGSRLTPFGALALVATIAAGGEKRLPSALAEAPRIDRAPRVMSEATARVLTRMMEVTTHSGTSREAFTDPATGRPYLGAVRVAGKTGTLEHGREETTSSWFVGFAPSRRPRVAVAVLLENGGVWREKANEVARDVFRAHFAARGFRGVTDPLAAR